MDKNFELLKFLVEGENPFHNRDIRGFFYERFGLRKDNLDDARWVQRFLNSLQHQAGFIIWGDSYNNNSACQLGEDYSDPSRHPGTLDHHGISAALTQPGHNHIINEIRERREADFEERQIKSLEKANNATDKSLRFQRVIGVWSTVLAGVSTLFIVVTAIDQSLDKTPQRLQEIEQAVRSQDTTLKTFQIYLKEMNLQIRAWRVETEKRP